MRAFALHVFDWDPLTAIQISKPLPHRVNELDLASDVVKGRAFRYPL